MPAQPFASPRPRAASARSLAALDFGLRVRLETRPAQGTLFSGADRLSLRELTTELSLLVSDLRVRSFVLRAEIESTTCALLVNVRCGFWPLARRAAIDLGAVLQEARKRRLADAELCLRGARCAFHVGDLCAQEVR